MVAFKDVLSPVSHLSDDEIRLLFDFVLSHFAHHETLCAAMVLSHVSRRWRAIALNSPLLWSHITHKYPSWIPVQLHRARSAALKVAWTSALQSRGSLNRNWAIAHLRCLLGTHISTVQSLSLDLGRNDYAEVQQHLQRPAPYMTSLTLKSVPFYPSKSVADVFVTTLDFHSPMILAHYSSLRALHLSEVVLPFPEEDAHSRSPALKRSTVSIVLGILHRLPLLETLHLFFSDLTSLKFSTAVSWLTDSSRELVERIELPHLRDLRVEVPNLHDAAVLSQHLLVDPRCSLDFSATYILTKDPLTVTALLRNTFPPRFDDQLPLPCHKFKLEGEYLNGLSQNLRIESAGLSEEMVLNRLQIRCVSMSAYPYVVQTMCYAQGLYDLTRIRSRSVLTPIPENINSDIRRSILGGSYANDVEELVLGYDAMYAVFGLQTSTILPTTQPVTAPTFRRCLTLELPDAHRLPDELYGRLIDSLQAGQTNCTWSLKTLKISRLPEDHIANNSDGFGWPVNVENVLPEA